LIQIGCQLVPERSESVYMIASFVLWRARFLSLWPKFECSFSRGICSRYDFFCIFLWC